MHECNDDDDDDDDGEEEADVTWCAIEDGRGAHCQLEWRMAIIVAFALGRLRLIIQSSWRPTEILYQECWSSVTPFVFCSAAIHRVGTVHFRVQNPHVCNYCRSYCTHIGGGKANAARGGN